MLGFHRNNNLRDIQAHHILPWELKEHPAIQKAAESGLFHMNAKGNGISLSTSIHYGSHPIYTEKIVDALDRRFNMGMTSSESFELLKDIQKRLRDQLENGVELNNVII